MPTWDNGERKWKVSVKTAAGSKEAEYSAEYEIKTDFLVSAVGQLNVPQWPEISGLDSFEGKKMHSARWDWSYDLQDKKIALIGNGCTAAQILPEIQRVAKHVTLFQRTPNWVVPRLDAPVTPLQRKAYRYIPFVASRKRAVQMDFGESVHSFVHDSEGPIAQEFSRLSKDMMHAQLPSQEDLWAKLTPTYNVGCKRVIISSDYFPALAQPNVRLETRSIESISGNQVNVKDSDSTDPVPASEEGYDLLVCATGFQSLDFMHPIKFIGKDGKALSEIWSSGAQALYGITVASMPNFGMLYGPNTNLGHNSIILMIEAQSRYISGLIKPVLAARNDREALALVPKESKLAQYNEMVQQELQGSAFNDPRCRSWYKNAEGKITNNWSRTVVEYQKMVEQVDFDDFEIEGGGRPLVEGKKVFLGRVREETMVSDRMLLIMGAVSTAALIGGWVLRNGRSLQTLRV